MPNRKLIAMAVTYTCMTSVEIELSWHMLEVEPLGSACGLIVRVDGVTKNNMQAFVELNVWLYIHSNRVKNNSY